MLFLVSVDFVKGLSANVLIDRQLSQAQKLKEQADSLGGNTDAAFVECLGHRLRGHSAQPLPYHADMPAKILDILNVMQIAMSTEDFGPSHKECMETMAEASQGVVEGASVC